MWCFYASLAVLLLPRSATCSCNYGSSYFPREASVPVSKYSYDGLTGPLNWYGLNKTANKLCSTGTQQSPININSTDMSIVPGTSINLTIPNYPSVAPIGNLGTAVEVDVHGTMAEHRKMYKLLQFHFHMPSEHHVDNKSFAMEVHFVFEAADEFTAVIGVLIELGSTTDDLLASVFARIEATAKPGSETITDPLRFGGLKSHIENNDIIHYDESLSKPLCSESIAWRVSKKTLPIDFSTFQKANKVTKLNSRHTQNELGGVNSLQNAANEFKFSKPQVGAKGLHWHISPEVIG